MAPLLGLVSVDVQIGTLISLTLFSLTVGPSELTVFEPEVFTVIGGPGTKCTKSAWYDMLWPLIALNSIREKEGYAPRRRLWDESFKPKGMLTQLPETSTFQVTAKKRPCSAPK